MSEIFHAKFVGKFIFYLPSKQHTTCSNSSLLISIKPRAKSKFGGAAMFPVSFIYSQALIVQDGTLASLFGVS
jgi:hypothetical protein